MSGMTWIAALLALVLSLLIVGCGGSPNSGQSTAIGGADSSGGGAPSTFDWLAAGERRDAAAGQVDLNKPFTCPTSPDSLGFMQPVDWPAEHADARWGSGVRQYSQVKSSKTVPVEACGARASYEYVAFLTCEDGSHPFTTLGDAQGARAGSLGGGGSCGLIIDLYVVKCPEAEYEIYVDMYHCSAGESLM